jgi:hypothetical protein
MGASNCWRCSKFGILNLFTSKLHRSGWIQTLHPCRDPEFTSQQASPVSVVVPRPCASAIPPASAFDNLQIPCSTFKTAWLPSTTKFDRSRVGPFLYLHPFDPVFESQLGTKPHLFDSFSALTCGPFPSVTSRASAMSFSATVRSAPQWPARHSLRLDPAR